MALRYRRRVLPTELGEGTTFTVNETRTTNGFLIRREVLPPSRRSLGVARGTQVTGSEGHPWGSRKRGSLQDVGGNFSSVKQVAMALPSHVSCVAESGSQLSGTYSASTYRGDCLPITQIGIGANLWPSLSTSSASQLDAFGATAVARCSPVSPVASLSNLLGELVRDGLPKLPLRAWEDGVRLFKEIARRKPGSIQELGRLVGDEHLNLEFGVKPLLMDLNKFLEGVYHADELLTQYERDAGPRKAVRRRYEFPLITDRVVSTFPTTDWPLIASQNTGYYNNPSGWSIVRTRETRVQRWFSGAFTYHLPSGYDSRKEMSRYGLLAKKILGLNVSPEVLWELAPWSWAVDWFSNTGDVIQNVTQRANDGLIMRYGYLMENTIVKDTYTRPVSPFKNGSPCGVVALVSESKVRRRANPFGFGASWAGLSPKQLSIAAALGLNRS